MKTYLATTKNENYSGMVARIRFKEGRATLNEEAVAGSDRDLPETIRVFKDLGITLTEIHKCPNCDKTCQSKFALAGHMKKHAKDETADEEAPEEEEIEKE